MKTTFSSASRLHDDAEHECVLEFVLTGAIPPGSAESAELARRAGNEMEKEIARYQARAVVINLLDFGASFGNEIVALLFAPYFALARSGGGEMAIVAAGQAATNLDNLLKTNRLDALYGTTKPDLASALANMTKTLPVSKGGNPAAA